MHKITSANINADILPPIVDGGRHRLRKAFDREISTLRLTEPRSCISDPVVADIFSGCLGFNIPVCSSSVMPMPQPGDMILVGEITVKQSSAKTTRRHVSAVVTVEWLMLEVHGQQTYLHVIDLMEHVDDSLPLFINIALKGRPESWVEGDRRAFVAGLHQHQALGDLDLYPFLVEEQPEGILVHSDAYHLLAEEVKSVILARESEILARVNIPDSVMFVEEENSHD